MEKKLIVIKNSFCYYPLVLAFMFCVLYEHGLPNNALLPLSASLFTCPSSIQHSMNSSAKTKKNLVLVFGYQFAFLCMTFFLEFCSFIKASSSSARSKFTEKENQNTGLAIWSRRYGWFASYKLRQGIK